MSMWGAAVAETLSWSTEARFGWLDPQVGGAKTTVYEANDVSQ